MITEHRHQEVRIELKGAIERENEAAQKLISAMDDVNRLKMMTKFKHENLGGPAGFIYITTECLDCGYVWLE